MSERPACRWPLASPAFTTDAELFLPVPRAFSRGSAADRRDGAGRTAPARMGNVHFRFRDARDQANVEMMNTAKTMIQRTLTLGQ